jgi:hypothetical protein
MEAVRDASVAPAQRDRILPDRPLARERPLVQSQRRWRSVDVRRARHRSAGRSEVFGALGSCLAAARNSDNTNLKDSFQRKIFQGFDFKDSIPRIRIPKDSIQRIRIFSRIVGRLPSDRRQAPASRPNPAGGPNATGPPAAGGHRSLGDYLGVPAVFFLTEVRSGDVDLKRFLGRPFLYAAAVGGIDGVVKGGRHPAIGSSAQHGAAWNLEEMDGSLCPKLRGTASEAAIET